MPPFQLSDRLRSLHFAMQGFSALISTQHNARIHLVATVAVVVSGAALALTATEWVGIILAISIVWMAEALNTGFEFVCDVVSPEHHPKVKQAKDVAAAGVLIASSGAAIAGATIFVPHLLALWV